ncbi:MAG: DUF349 domain-containing protein [Cytophagaceae bacterium]|nr:DUF349 domain-containing protein [Cytophagaceae bacterium]
MNNKERELAETEKSSEVNNDPMKNSLEEDTQLEQQEEQVDLSAFSKEELFNLIQNYKITNNPSQDNSFLKDIKFHFDHITDSEKAEALQKFVEEGGKEEDFEFRKDKTAQKFDKAYESLRTQITQYFNNLEKEREKNLKIKNELLEKLRQLTSSEETTTSIQTLKEIQDEWKKTGPVPTSYSQNLWASYNALVEMFYNNRSIYFELKELDRKKNLESKKELTEKAEQLVNNLNIGFAIRELRTLHEEFKHIGPVPKEDQEALWAKFKAASDKIYDRRKEHYAGLKKQLDENYKKKQELIEKIDHYSQFKTEKIDEWKSKTAEVLSLQEEWKKTGRIPKEKAKDASKKFWSACKLFFNNKNAFFKALEIQKEENLKLKIQLCEQAESLKDNDDMKNTASALKDLQKKWEGIGPVPIKMKEEVYKRFKAACDSFFNRKREQYAEVEKEFEGNLQKKITIIDKIENLAEQNEKNPDELKTIQEEWKNTGFVPKSEIKNINERYNKAIEKYISSLESLNRGEKDDLKLALQLAVLKGSPMADKKLHRKESDLHKRISNLRKEIERYNNNINFLSKSSKADGLRQEINSKIQEAENELKTLENQLKVLKEA